MNKLIVFGLVLSAVVCLAQGKKSWYGKGEETCSSQGGQCIKKSECERPVDPKRELCPKQAAKGYQCCYGLPKSETRCEKHGGQCFKKGHCNNRVVYKEASDCKTGQDCCILV